MPNRIIKESICTSEEIDLLTPEQEVFFYRLMVVVDDFGLMDARLSILKARCYPLKSIDINCMQMNLAALQAVGLIQLYQVNEKPYLSITKWANHQQIRAKRAKYPMPDEGSDINCNQLITNVPVIQSNPIQSPRKPSPAKADGFVFKAELLNTGADPVLVTDWLAVRAAKKARNTKTAFDGFVREVNKSGFTYDQALRLCCEKNWKGFEAEWVKDIKPAQPLNTPPFDFAAFEAKKKADMAIAREAYKREQEAASVPVRAAK